MRKPAFCMCENKDADQLRGNRGADQCLCFRYTDGTIPLLPKYEIYYVDVQPDCIRPGRITRKRFSHNEAPFDSHFICNNRLTVTSDAH